MFSYFKFGFRPFSVSQFFNVAKLVTVLVTELHGVGGVNIPSVVPLIKRFFFRAPKMLSLP